MENFTILLKKYADFIVRVGVNPQPGQTLVINCCLEAAPLARLCVRSAYEAGARDVLVNWSDNDVSRSRMELGSEEALSDFKSWQLKKKFSVVIAIIVVLVIIHLLRSPLYCL